MNRLKTEDFLSYTYLSGVRLTEDGVFFIAAKADMEKNGYEKNIYALIGNDVRKLTSGGLAGGYQVREGKVFFAAKRSDKEKKKNKLAHYRATTHSLFYSMLYSPYGSHIR